MRAFPEVDYTAGADETPVDYPSLQHKLEKAIEVTRIGLESYERPAVMWTGGKDSTLTLYLAREIANERDLAMPQAIFIDHFQHFRDLSAFVEKWASRWDVPLTIARNEDVGAHITENDIEPGDAIHIEDLSEHNRFHIREILEYEDDTFPFLLDTYVGNHLLKTVALNDALEANNIDGIISGVRWDEQDARADETFFSPRHDPAIYPEHDRIHPILPFTERDIWDATWTYLVPEVVDGYPAGHRPTGLDDFPDGITIDDIPVSPKYFSGFRSLGSEVSTKKSTNQPAWLQDLEGTTERAGRAQDKENLMERLRDLGYM